MNRAMGFLVRSVLLAGLALPVLWLGAVSAVAMPLAVHELKRPTPEM